VDDLLAALAEQHAELAQLVDGCTDEDWERPTRCVGWDVASVLLHLAQTDEMARASARGELESLADGLMGPLEQQTVTVDEAAAQLVGQQRSMGGPAIRQRWHDASRTMRAALGDADPHARVTWATNRLSVQTLAATRLSECWIHTDDIAGTLAIELAPTDRLRFIARLAWRTLPYAFARAETAMHGPVALDLVSPGGERWRFDPEAAPLTTIRGSVVEFCDVAARRADPNETELVGDGPDVDAVLRLVRTYAL
jgi:uncharacterized protein (TIGR03084 family)